MKNVYNIQKDLIKKAMNSGGLGELVFATVATTNPISIYIEESQDAIPEEFIIIGALCTRYVLPIKHKHIGCENPYTGFETEDVEVWRGLAVGDKVICIKLNNGQIFYIMQRVSMEGFK